MSSAKIQIQRGKNKGTQIKVSAFPITIGRDDTNTVELDDDEVSRFHARIKKRGRLYILEDLESRNGVLLNGEKVLNAIVQNDDKILIGTTELVFHTTAPEFHIANEIISLQMSFSDESGLEHPIDIENNLPSQTFQPRRLNLRKEIDTLAKSLENTQKIFSYSGDFLVKVDLEDAMNTLLKVIGQNVSHLARGVVFITFAKSRKLVPAAVRHFNGDTGTFSISHRALQDVNSRKQPLMMKPSSDSTSRPEPARVIIPVISNSHVVAMIHLESDAGAHAFPIAELAFCQAVISRISPIVDNILLRRELDSWMLAMVESLIATIEAKDTYTVGHSERVCKYSMAIAEELKLNNDVKKQLMISSLCHDIGKVGIPDLILKKASILSHEEYEEMKLHPTIGAKIIENMPGAQRFLSGIKYHHEKWDGTGYPDGLVGEEIPFFGRIVAVADAFDAMISGRSYSGFMNEAEAVEQLSKDQDLFDPEVIKAFTRAWDNGILTPKTGTKAKPD